MTKNSLEERAREYWNVVCYLDEFGALLTFARSECKRQRERDAEIVRLRVHDCGRNHDCGQQIIAAILADEEE